VKQLSYFSSTYVESVFRILAPSQSVLVHGFGLLCSPSSPLGEHDEFRNGWEASFLKKKKPMTPTSLGKLGSIAWARPEATASAGGVVPVQT
jgi:hypothetical protein